MARVRYLNTAPPEVSAGDTDRRPRVRYLNQPRRQLDEIQATDFGEPEPIDLPNPAQLPLGAPEPLTREEENDAADVLTRRMSAAEAANDEVRRNQALTPTNVPQGTLPAPKPLRQVLEEQDADPGAARLADRMRNYTPEMVREATRNPQPEVRTAAENEWRRRYRMGEMEDAGRSIAAPGQTIGGNLAEIPKGVPAGAMNVAATALKGMGALSQEERIRVAPFVEALQRAPTMTPGERHRWRLRAFRELDGVTAQNFQAAMSDADAGETPDVQGVGEANPDLSLKGNRAYQQGVSLANAAKKVLPAAPGYERSIGRNLGEGAGSVVAGLGLGAVPGVGQLAAAGTFALAGAGEAVDRALAAGATEEQIIRAAKLGTLPGMTDSIPVETMLGRIPVPGGRFIKVPAGMLGAALRSAGRMGWQAFIEGVQEGGQTFLQNLIAREVYKPDQDLGAGIIPDAGTGAGVGALTDAGRQLFVGGRRAVRQQLADRREEQQFNELSQDVAAEQARAALSPDNAQMRVVTPSAPAPSPAPDAQPAAGGDPLPSPAVAPAEELPPAAPPAEPPAASEPEPAVPEPEPAEAAPAPAFDPLTASQEDYEAAIWQALQQRFDGGKPITVATSGRQTIVRPRARQNLRFENGRIEMREGSSWVPLAAGNQALDSIAQQLGFPTAWDRTGARPDIGAPEPVEEEVPELWRPTLENVQRVMAGRWAHKIDPGELEEIAANFNTDLDGFSRLLDEVGYEPGEAAPPAANLPPPQAPAPPGGLPSGAPAREGRPPDFDGALKLAGATTDDLVWGNGSRGIPLSPGYKAAEKTLREALGKVTGKKRFPYGSLTEDQRWAIADEIARIRAQQPPPPPPSGRLPGDPRPPASQPPASEPVAPGIGRSVEPAPLYYVGNAVRDGTAKGWQQTWEQFYEDPNRDHFPILEHLFKNHAPREAHRLEVEAAIALGLPVPDAVLAEYADWRVYGDYRDVGVAFDDRQPHEKRSNEGNQNGTFAELAASMRRPQAPPQPTEPAPMGSRMDLESVLEDDRSLEEIRAEQRPPIAFAPVKNDVAVTPEGKDVAVEYAIVDADSLIPSQTDDGAPNPAFPQGLQPRDRTRDASLMQIAELAQKLNPRLLGESPSVTDGAPIVDAAGIVESGNGRTLAIRRAYGMGLPTAELYRQHLTDMGYPVAGIAKPMLVRIRRQDMSILERAAFARVANKPTMLSMGDAEQAMADAAQMPDEMSAAWRGGEVTDARNRDFVKAFIDLVVSPNERGPMLTADGGLSNKGIQRIRAAMLAKAYGDTSILAAVTEETDSDIKTIGKALLEAAPEWARMRLDVAQGHIDPSMDITPHLLEAVELVRRARALGQPVTDFYAQSTMFDTGPSPESRAILHWFFTNDALTKPVRFPAPILKSLQFYAQNARKTGGLFASGQSSAELVTAAKGSRDEKSQGSLLALPDTDPRNRRRLAAGQQGGDRAGSPAPAERGEGSERDRGPAGELRASRAGDSLAYPVAGPRVHRQRRGGAHPALVAPVRVTRIPELIERLRKRLDVKRRFGRISMRGAAGTYNRKSGMVRVKEGADIEVFAHEAGHHLEMHYGAPLQALMRQHAAELKPLDYMPNRKDQKTALKEGFAEWFSIWMLNPAAAQQAAPGFTADFEAMLQRDHPVDAAELRQLQDAYQTYLNAPSVDAVISGVVSGDKGGGFARALKWLKGDSKAADFAAWARAFYRGTISSTDPIYRGTKRLLELYERNHIGKKGNTLRLDLQVGQDPAKLARLAMESHGAGYIDVLYGVVDYIDGRSMGSSLAEAVQTALENGWNGDVFHDFNSYLVSRRAIHLWDRYDAGELDNPPTREKKADHEQAIADLEAQHPKFKDAAILVYGFANNLWRKKRDAGLITEEQYQEGLQNNQDYVPFLRDRSDIGEGLPGGHPLSGKNSAVRQLRGSQRDIIFPVESLMRDAYITERLIAQNDVKLALRRLAKAAGRGGGEIFEQIPNKQIEMIDLDLEKLKEIVWRQAKLEGQLGNVRDANMLQSIVMGLDSLSIPGLKLYRQGEINEKGEPIVFVWVNGKREAWRLPDGDFGKEMYDVLTGLDREVAHPVLDFIGTFTSALRLGVTHDPAYQAANLLRDIPQSWIMYGGLNPITALTRFGKGAVSAASRDEHWQAYVAHGGIMGGQDTASMEQKQIQAMKDLSKKGIIVQRLGSVRALSQMTEFSESATRLGLFRQFYKEAIARGLPEKMAILEATYNARDYMDYGRHGAKMLWARKAVAFLNANIQGTDKQIRHLGGYGAVQAAFKSMTTRGYPMTATEKRMLRQTMLVWLKVAIVGAIGLSITMMYADDPEYEEIDKNLRASHWFVKMRDGLWGAMPKPFSWALMSNITERFFERYYYDDPEAMGRLVTGLGKMFVPEFVPTFLKPILEHWGNKSFYDGRPVIPEKLQGIAGGGADARQANAYTSSLGRWLGENVGGSPILWDHYIKGYTASLGRTFLSMTTAVDPNAPDLGPEDTFFLRRFFRDPTRGAVSQNQFYDEVSRRGGRMTGPLNVYRDLMKQELYGEAVKYLDTLEPDQRAYAIWRNDMKGQKTGGIADTKMHPLQRAEEVASALRKVQEDVRTSKTLTPEQKRTVGDLLSQRVIAELRNSLIVVGAKGYAKRRLIDLDANMKKIEAASPEVAEAIEERTERTPSFDEVKEFYPDLLSIVKDELESLRQTAKTNPGPSL